MFGVFFIFWLITPVARSTWFQVEVWCESFGGNWKKEYCMWWLEQPSCCHVSWCHRHFLHAAVNMSLPGRSPLRQRHLQVVAGQQRPVGQLKLKHLPPGPLLFVVLFLLLFVLLLLLVRPWRVGQNVVGSPLSGRLWRHKERDGRFNGGTTLVYKQNEPMTVQC